MAHYRQIKLIDTAEGTVATSASVLEAHSFTLKSADFPGAALPKISATNIGAATITLWEKVAGTWVQVYKNDQAVELDSANPQEAINSYGTYAVAKAAATTGIEVFVTKVR
jgi:acetyl-CoA carboxylase carboxyltransferase component